MSPTPSELLEKYGLSVAAGVPTAILTNLTDTTKSVTITKGTLKGRISINTTGSAKLYRASKSGIKIKFKATNESNTVEKEYTLKIKGVEPSITSPTAEDLGATFMPSTGTAPMNKGVGVVGRALPTTNAITIQAGKGTLPITMTASGLYDGLTYAQTYGSLDANVTTAAGASEHTTANAIPALTITGTPTKAGKMSVTVNAENDLKKVSKKFTLTILDSPDITTSKLGDATYGKAYTAKLAGKGGDKDHPLRWYATGLPTGFKINSADGTISGTISNDVIAFKAASTDTTVNITVYAVSYADANYGNLSTASTTATAVKAVKTFPLKIKTVKPIFLSADAFKDTVTLSASQTVDTAYAKTINAKVSERTKGAWNTTNGFVIWAGVPGTTIKITGLPDGLTSSDPTPSEAQKKAGIAAIKYITGTPTAPAKKATATITATNGAGSTSMKFNMIIDAAAPTITQKKTGTTTDAVLTATTKTGVQSMAGTGATDANASKKVGQSYDVTLTATPGPIKWKASKLPSGVKLTASGDTQARLKGTITKEQAPTSWDITATNTQTGKSTSLTAQLAVYASPDITTKSLSAATAGKHYTGKVALKGTDASFSAATVKVSGASGTAANMYKTKYNLTESNKTIGYLQFISDDKGKYFISADFERLPSTGALDVTLTATNPAGITVTKSLSLDIKGVAPKFTTSKLYDKTPFVFDKPYTKGVSIDVTGTKPISYIAYIASKDVKKFGLGTEEKWIKFTDKTAEATTGFKLESKDADGGMTILLNVPTKSLLTLKGLPITVEAINPAADGKWTKKAYKVDVTGSGVDWKYVKAAAPAAVATGTAKALSADVKNIDIDAIAGVENTAFAIFTMSGDKPWVVTTKPTSGDTENGINGILVKGTGSTVTIYGTPTAGKETKSKISLTITNPSTKSKRAVTVTILAALPPTLSSKDVNDIPCVVFSKDFELGKKVSVKMSAKGSKTIRYGIATGNNPISGGVPTGVTTAATLKSVMGLSFDFAKGTITGTPLMTTSSSKVFAPMIINVSASNKGGTSGIGKIYLGVKGAKFKVTTKTFTVSNAAASTTKLSTDLTSGASNVTWDLAEGASHPTGVTLNPTGTITVAANTPANKGATVKLVANNVGTMAKGSVKVVITDPEPTINVPTISAITASSTDKVEQDVALTLTTGSPTGDTKIKWTLSEKPSDSKIKMKLKADDKEGSKATLTITVPKGWKASSGTSATVTAKVKAVNSLSKAEDEKTISVTIRNPGTTGNGALPDDEGALPDDEEASDEPEQPAETETESEEPESESEGEVTIGEARTAESLTAGQRALIEKEGYIIAAILPEVKATVSGQYDFDVELDEAAPEGAKLIWLAFPKDSEPSEDDEIADFYDEAGAPIEEVPAGRKIVVSPWLTEGVTYAPVIVVKGGTASGAGESLDGAGEGDTVTLEALEEAAGK